MGGGAVSMHPPTKSLSPPCRCRGCLRALMCVGGGGEHAPITHSPAAAAARPEGVDGLCGNDATEAPDEEERCRGGVPPPPAVKGTKEEEGEEEEVDCSHAATLPPPPPPPALTGADTRPLPPPIAPPTLPASSAAVRATNWEKSASAPRAASLAAASHRTTSPSMSTRRRAYSSLQGADAERGGRSGHRGCEEGGHTPPCREEEVEEGEQRVMKGPHSAWHRP